MNLFICLDSNYVALLEKGYDIHDDLIIIIKDHQHLIK